MFTFICFIPHDSLEHHVGSWFTRAEGRLVRRRGLIDCLPIFLLLLRRQRVSAGDKHGGFLVEFRESRFLLRKETGTIN